MWSSARAGETLGLRITSLARTVPTETLWLAGEILQLALYSLAVESIMERSVAEGRLYYCTVAGGFSERVVSMNSQTREQPVRFSESLTARSSAASFHWLRGRKPAIGVIFWVYVVLMKKSARLRRINSRS